MTQRNAVLAGGLHAGRGNDPHPADHVDLIPPGAVDLPRPSCCQNCEFQRQRRNGLTLRYTCAAV